MLLVHHSVDGKNGWVDLISDFVLKASAVSCLAKPTTDVAGRASRPQEQRTAPTCMQQSSIGYVRLADAYEYTKYRPSLLQS